MIGKLCHESVLQTIVSHHDRGHFGVYAGSRRDLRFWQRAGTRPAAAGYHSRRYNWSLQFRFTLVQLFYPASRRAWLYSAGFLRSVYISQHGFPVGPTGLLWYTANQRIGSVCTGRICHRFFLHDENDGLSRGDLRRNEYIPNS